ncbi:MAG: hypothetical protein NZ740_09215 [Kiritimatiellae bacterium]|nr:hypothetical protein [Kiritimatiellia bacterium]MDW8459272.1 sialate O-acetylesterase [Verrucomicrobiota bacterium]
MLRLHPLLQDHAIIQADRPLEIRGLGRPRESIEVSLGRHRTRVTAGEDGRWTVEFPAVPAGEELDLTASGASETVEARRLLAGDVWLCSGQSNMEWQLELLPHARSDVESANDPWTRFFVVERSNERTPVDSVRGQWRHGVRDHVGKCSAVAWYFAQRVRRETGRPVGLIVSAWGGTSILAWMSLETLKQRSEYASHVAEYEAARSTHERVNMSPHPYFPRLPEAAGWEDPDFDDRLWQTLRVPCPWQQQGWYFNGVVWYRVRIRLPEEWIGRPLTLNLGVVDDFDETYVNGERVGGLGPECPEAYKTPRCYPVPASLTQGGTLVIAVRVFDHWGEGGMMTPGNLHPEGRPDEAIPLPSIWIAKPEAELRWRTGSIALAPSELYNGMIHPLIGYPLRGVLWYQGESDVRRAQRYRKLLPDFIASIRSAWNDPRLPFGLVQLASYMPTQPVPVESEWAELREAQWLTSRELSDIGLISAMDLGDALDVHPGRKQPVGERLAGWALAAVYSRADIDWRHPEWESAETGGRSILLRFRYCGAGLRTTDGAAPRGFQIAGSNRTWKWALARVAAPNAIAVHHPDISDPVAVRYAWQSNPDANVVGANGLPLLPFRTDAWPLITPP